MRHFCVRFRAASTVLLIVLYFLVVSTAHLVVTCATAPGAGLGLKWLVRIGGQDSVYPTTSYAPPLISTLTGPGAVDGEALNHFGSLFA